MVCLIYSGKYFIHFRNESKLLVNLMGLLCKRRLIVFEVPVISTVIWKWGTICHTKDPPKSFWSVLLTCKEFDPLVFPEISVYIATGRGCVFLLMTPSSTAYREMSLNDHIYTHLLLDVIKLMNKSGWTIYKRR